MAPTVYRYGAREPAENTALVCEQLFLAHRYRNLLVEVERARRGAVRATLDVPAVRAATAVAEATADGPARAAAWLAVRRARRQAADLECADALAAIEDRVKAFRKLARARSGLSPGAWGTYLLIEQAADAQRQSLDDPRFRRWDGTGRIGVQLQGGLSVADALGGADTRLRIEPQADAASLRTGGKHPGSRRAGRQRRVMLRVGTGEHRAPVWTVFTVTLHRPLPADGRIKWAVLRRYRIGPDYRWDFQATVEAAPASDAKTVSDRTGMVAVDLGWRVRPDGQRVGYWQDDRGQHGEFVLPGAVRDKLEHARSLGAIRQRLANGFRDRLVGWIRDSGNTPDWLAREAATLSEWRSADRLARLARRWRANRYAGDESIYAARPDCPRDRNGVLDCAAHVECWGRKDRHLARWCAHETAKALGRRNEAYRLIAADLARRYRAVVIEKFDLRQVAGRRALGDAASDAENAKADRASSVRHVVAPGTFRLVLLNACRRRGTAVTEIEAAYTTQDCAGCGARNDFDAAAAIEHRCSACGSVWDQDRNAARNLLAASRSVTPPNGKALAAGKSARQQRFSRNRRAEATAPEHALEHRSRTGAEVGGTLDGAGSAAEILAQEEKT